MELSQSEIVERLGIDKSGIDISERILDEFVKSYRLSGCRHVNPFTTPCFSLDLFLETELTDRVDMLVAFDKGRLGEESGKPIKHFCLVVDYDSGRDRVFLHDPSSREPESLELPSLMNAMQAREDPRYGFYVIES